MREPAFTLKNISITAPDGSAILKDAALSIHAGEVILLVGKSGAGKSTLLKLLAGLLDTGAGGWSVDGTLEYPGAVNGLSAGSAAVGGYIFQNYAVFDELTVIDNINIAKAHAERADLPPAELVARLISDIPGKNTAHECSGGQQQRVAIARTIHSSHNILFYDEPNSGLDVDMTKKLSSLIRSLASETGKPAIIIAHHYKYLLPVVDRVVALDRDSKNIVEMQVDAGMIEAYLGEGSDADLRLKEAAELPRKTLGAKTVASHARPFRLYWLGRYFLHFFMAQAFSPTVIMFMIIGGLITGFVSTWFLFNNFPYKEYLTPLLQDDTLASLGFVQWRVIVPLMTAVLLAARNSAIVSADVGHRVYSSQIDAMRNLFIPYRGYLFASVLMNMVIASVVFTFVNFGLCAWMSMFTWKRLFPGESAYYWNEVFYSKVLPQGSIVPAGISWVLLKMVLSGIAIAFFSWHFGMKKKQSVIDLNNGIALAIIWATTSVLIIHAITAMTEF